MDLYRGICTFTMQRSRLDPHYAVSELYVPVPRREARHPVMLQPHGPLHEVVAGLGECAADRTQHLRSEGAGLGLRVQPYGSLLPHMPHKTRQMPPSNAQLMASIQH